MVLSLISFIISHFHLGHHLLTIHCIEPAIVESQNFSIANSNHVLEISLSSEGVSPVSNFLQLLFQMSLISTGIDISFLSNDTEWKCV